MIEIRVNGITCEPGEIEVGATGSFGMQELHFAFSAEWDGLAKRTTWMTDAGKIEVLLDGLDRCKVPAEATATAGRRYFSVDGMAEGKHQISARAVYKVRETVPPGGENSSTPTDEEMVQALAILEEMKALKTPEVEVGTTKTVAAGNPAKVQNSGTATKAVLDFEIPRGESGVYVGEEEPGEDVMLWIVPEGENEIDEAILDINESVKRAEKAAQEAEGAVTGAAEKAAKIVAEAVVGETKDELQNYVDAAQEAAEITAHPPEIREDVWWVWDTGKNAYVSSGISAAGVPGPAGKDGVGIKAIGEKRLSSGSRYLEVTLTDGAVKSFPLKDGETPVKGDDYWTDEDKQEIVEDVLNNTDVKNASTYAETAEQAKKDAEEAAERAEAAGLPTGGSTGDVLTKTASGTEWKAPSGGGSSIQTYKTEDIGELYPAPADYTAWCPGDLRWDKTLGKFVSLLYAAPAHVHSTADLYVSHIDPESYVATQPVKCKYVDTDGVTDITPASAGACSYLILSDGSYLMIRHMDDGNTYKFTSTDNGVTWVKVSAVTGYNGHPWNMTELSNGRIILSDDASKVGLYYSDDDGVSWTQVIPATAGGDYEADACILELEAGKLIATARKSMDGAGGDSEAALFASSEDYGTTWTGWKPSSIDNMRSSSCTGIVHDGIVEVFAASRWSDSNTDYINTGKHGAIIHYMATVENAFVDNFTRVGVIDYARGAALECHSPCAAIDDNERLLLAHMDGGNRTKCNHRFIRGELNGINYRCTEDGESDIKSFSAKFTSSLFAAMTERLNTLQFALSKIEGSGVDVPSGTFLLIKSYVAANMKDSAIFPWQSGSDFEGCCAAGYDWDTTDDSPAHYFVTEDNGNVYMYGNNHTYRVAPSENAEDFYIKLIVRDGFHSHIVKDGYITVFDYQWGVKMDYTAGTESLKNVTTPQSGSVVELHDGHVFIDGTRYEVPKISIEDYIANYSSSSTFSRHARITELTYGSPSAITNTADHCGMTGQNGYSYYGVEYYEKFAE